MFLNFFSFPLGFELETLRNNQMSYDLTNTMHEDQSCLFLFLMLSQNFTLYEKLRYQILLKKKKRR